MATRDNFKHMGLNALPNFKHCSAREVDAVIGLVHDRKANL